MSGTPFKARAALGDLPKGAERAIIEQFRAIEASLNRVQVVQRNATPVLNVPAYMAKPGELVLLEGNATGTLVTLPPGSPQNIEQTIRVALVGGVLSPGVTIAIVGRKGTIDGTPTKTMTTRSIVELTSVGERGWVSPPAGGGGGGESLAATLAIGNTTGGTDLIITAGDELQVGGTAGVLGQVFTSGGPGASPSWVTSTAATLAQAKLIASMRA